MPETEEVQTEVYKRNRGVVWTQGIIFECKFCALVFVRMKNLRHKFELATNVEGHGYFDDAFVKYIDENYRKSHIFVQVKFKRSHTITMQQLLKPRTGDFSLRKVYESYIQIEKQFNCSGEGVKLEGSIDESLFIIYTNTDVEQGLKSYNVIDFSQAQFLMTGGSVLQFNEEEHPGIYEHLQDLPKHREFLSRLRICYSQAGEMGMDRHIKSELQQIMELPDSLVDIACTYFIDIMMEWWQHEKFVLKDTNPREKDPLRKTSERIGHMRSLIREK